MSAPDTARDLVDRALAASAGADTALALELLRQAQAAAPSWHVPVFLRGAELAGAGRHEEAEAAYAAAVVLEPGFEIARFQLGLLQFNDGRVAVAMLTWQPLMDAALRALVSGFAELAGGDRAAAQREFERALALGCGNAPLEADIRRMMQRLCDADPGAGEGTHALLANYRRQGGLH